MKRIFAALCSALAVVVLAVGLSGCGDALSGKTYIFLDITVEYADDLTETQRNLIDITVESNRVLFYNVVYVFNSDGTVERDGTVYNYTIEGDTVTIGEGTGFGYVFQMVDDDLVAVNTSVYGTITMIFAQL